MTNKLFGIIILLIGVSFLLVNVGYVDFEIGALIATYWPLIIIYIGLKETFKGLVHFSKKLARGKWRMNKLFWGLFYLSLGVVLQGNNLQYFNISLGQYWSWIWPTFIIYFGLTILFNRNSNLIVVDLSGVSGKNDLSNADVKKRKKASSYKQKKQFIGDINIGSSPWLIEDFDTWVGIGDITIDLTTAILKEGENTIDISGWIGDVKVIVPHDVPTEVNVDVKLGDVNIFNNKQSGTNRTVSYRSEDYDFSDKKVSVSIKLSIGDIKVRHAN